MRFINKSIILFLLLAFAKNSSAQEGNIRTHVDTVGFAQYNWQMDSVVARINKMFGTKINPNRNLNVSQESIFKTVISPHDDYAYAGYMYMLALSKIKAKTIIIIGVAHKAKSKITNKPIIENKIIFENFNYWKEPYGKIKVSDLRQQIMAGLPQNYYVVSDSLHKLEHSIEAEVPFLQYFNKNIEIIPIQVPYMPYDTANVIAKSLAKSIYNAMNTFKLQWGKDIAIVISSDAVHYGDEDWGGKNCDVFGVDTAGYRKAIEHEHEIINECLTGKIDLLKIKKFTEYTVSKENYVDYKWTWCGRYSIPMGLLTSFYLCKLLNTEMPSGKLLDYSTSIDHTQITVKDIGMGVTAPAKLRHWVGYVAVGYY
ncbi:MAG: AmmeMemoRadiSam system protein B [Bacteroidales bacterium]|nr:AmmeMemoRadiSam system protein B [Bacteroidales bacterium]